MNDQGPNQRPLREIVEEQLTQIVVRELKTGKFVDMPSELFANLLDMALSNPIYHVEEFHRRFGLHVHEEPVPPRSHEMDFRHRMDYNDLCDLRLKLLREELDEYADADCELNELEMVDALGDIIYVAVGAALELGLPIRLACNEIHRSNMTKLGADGEPLLREDGKIMKGPGYEKPDMAKVFRQWQEEKGKV